jgi:hypothetical protein
MPNFTDQIFTQERIDEIHTQSADTSRYRIIGGSICVGGRVFGPDRLIWLRPAMAAQFASTSIEVIS